MPKVSNTVFASTALLPEVWRNSGPIESVYPLRQHPVQLQHIRDDVEKNLVGARGVGTLEGVLYTHDHCVRAVHDRGPSVCDDRKADKAKEGAEQRRPIGIRRQDLENAFDRDRPLLSRYAHLRPDKWQCQYSDASHRQYGYTFVGDLDYR